jgi:epoxyqueuosine reductase
MKPKLLLHVCCAICQTTALERLLDQYRVTSYFYGPNIHPLAEYELRLKEAAMYAAGLEVPLIAAEYEVAAFDKAVAGHEGDAEGGPRCKLCFQLRLERTARYAAEQGFELFTTTLTLSPHKNAKLINLIGEQLGIEHKVEYLPSDFKKKDGFRRAGELSKKANLYRQNYCGCSYSLAERDLREK